MALLACERPHQAPRSPCHAARAARLHLQFRVWGAVHGCRQPAPAARVLPAMRRPCAHLQPALTLPYARARRAPPAGRPGCPGRRARARTWRRRRPAPPAPRPRRRPAGRRRASPAPARTCGTACAPAAPLPGRALRPLHGARTAAQATAGPGCAHVSASESAPLCSTPTTGPIFSTAFCACYSGDVTGKRPA